MKTPMTSQTSVFTNADVRKLTELMDWLDPDDRRFLYLRYTQEMGYKEYWNVAEHLRGCRKKARAAAYQETPKTV